MENKCLENELWSHFGFCNFHLLLIHVLFNTLLESLTVTGSLHVFRHEGVIHFVHLGTLAIRFVFPVNFELWWEQLGGIAVHLEHFVNLDALEGFLVIHFDSLFDFLLNQVIHVLELDLHVRCAISVNLFVDLDLGYLAEAAAVTVSLDHMVVVLLILRPVLVPDEA